VGYTVDAIVSDPRTADFHRRAGRLPLRSLPSRLSPRRHRLRKKEARASATRIGRHHREREEGFGIFLDQSTKTALRLKSARTFRAGSCAAIQGREVTMEKDQQTAVLTLRCPAPGSPLARSI